MFINNFYFQKMNLFELKCRYIDKCIYFIEKWGENGDWWGMNSVKLVDFC